MARKYEMRCPVARALDVIGDRWTILILRDLFLNDTRRFQDFLASMPGLTSSVLSHSIEGARIERSDYQPHVCRPSSAFGIFSHAEGQGTAPDSVGPEKWGQEHTVIPPHPARSKAGT